MKRQRRSRSRKSSAPAATAISPRSGEPTHPHRSGETASSSARYGERASYASAAPERMHHWRSEGGSPSSGEETTVRPKRRQKKERSGDRYVWIPRRLLQQFDGNLQAAFEAYVDEGGDIVTLPFKREVGPCYQVQYDHSSSSSIRSGDVQEEVPFDGEETSLPLKMDKKPESTCSRDRGKITQDEDEDEDGQSDKKPCPAVEDEQDSSRIGVHAIEEHKKEQESTRGHVQALLNVDDETIRKEFLCSAKRLKSASPARRAYGPEYEEQELLDLHQQLALYRIKAKLTDDRELDDEDLKLKYPPSKLLANNFFQHYEETLEWYFDIERCMNDEFDNYQRLVLRNRGYLDWELYRDILNTYEEDLAYVQYFEEVANQTKWVQDYLGDSTIKWERIRDVANIQALDIAAGFPDVPPYLVSYGFREYFCNISSDYSRKGLDGLYFEIWKRVAKGNMSFKEALLEIHREDMFPLRSSDIKHELENTPYRFPLKDYYDAHVAGIDKMVADAKVRQLIREIVVKIASTLKRKVYLDYARKKLDIARDIGLIPKENTDVPVEDPMENNLTGTSNLGDEDQANPCADVQHQLDAELYDEESKDPTPDEFGGAEHANANNEVAGGLTKEDQATPKQQEPVSVDGEDAGAKQQDIALPDEQKWSGWPGESVFRILVPVSKVGAVIGRKGDFIKKMIEESKARIKVLVGPQDVPERAVMISAKDEPDVVLPPAVDGLLRVHKRITDGLDDETEQPQRGTVTAGPTRLLVPASQAGSLIGKQGGTIKSIQDASKCVLQILENVPPVALNDDRVVEIQGEPLDTHKAVELIASHLRKFLVDRSVLPLFESQMKPHNVHWEQPMPPPQPWGPAPPAPWGHPPNLPPGGPGYAGNPQYMPPRPQDNYYPPPHMPPVEKQPHYGISSYGRDAPPTAPPSGNQHQAHGSSHVTQSMQVPLSYADAVTGAAGANISHISMHSGTTASIQEGALGKMAVEITGSASQEQTAQQLIKNFVAEASTQGLPVHAPPAQPVDKGYSSYPPYGGGASYVSPRGPHNGGSYGAAPYLPRYGY